LNVIDSGATETLAGLIGKSRYWYILDCAHGKRVSAGCGALQQAISHASAFTDDHNIRDAATGCPIWTRHRKKNDCFERHLAA
jgi:hypothetical protein